jgi:hypothetical protein
MASGVKKMMYAVVLQLYQLKLVVGQNLVPPHLLRTLNWTGGAGSLLPPSRRPT